MVRRALGRGLEALIPAAVETEVPILPETPETASPGAEPSTGAESRDSRPIDPRSGDPKALARAVTALVGAPDPRPAAESRPGDIQHVPLARIARNPAQPRTQFDPATIKELADSIRERGVLQPVLLRPANGGYHAWPSLAAVAVIAERQVADAGGDGDFDPTAPQIFFYEGSRSRLGLLP